jgi:hypothetical protein
MIKDLEKEFKFSKGKFNLNGKDIELKPGTFIFMNKNEPHFLSADEDLAYAIEFRQPINFYNEPSSSINFSKIIFSINF